jgi:hypothetical protein
MAVTLFRTELEGIMAKELTPELEQVLEACKGVEKSSAGEFSYKWLRLEGNILHQSKLTQLVKLGYLRVNYNGIVRRGTPWYSVA